MNILRLMLQPHVVPGCQRVLWRAVRGASHCGYGRGGALQLGGLTLQIPQLANASWTLDRLLVGADLTMRVRGKAELVLASAATRVYRKD